ncbi:MAG: hypothetical protein J4F36_02925 [Nitrosopumilaceae archaeon]|nr:hypothetical protein [Nitrosopumilaceae archaeon]
MEQTLITITIPECEIEPQIDIDIQDDVPPQEDNSPDSEQCTPDPFGYGEIVVVNNWGNYETLPENSGYILSWGWEIEYKKIETDDPYSNVGSYSTDGIIVNYTASGQFGYDIGPTWGYAYDSKLERELWTANSGIYTFEIVDFENNGSYCGDDKITINVE